MRKIFLPLAAAFCFLLISNVSNSQNNLAAGDIAIVSYQSDFDPTNTFTVGIAEREDRFSIVVLKPGGLAAGTVIYFTDRGWNAPFSTWYDESYPPAAFGTGHEAVIRWTVPAGGIPQGTEVFFINIFHDELPVGSEYYQWFAYSDEPGTIPLGTVTNETPIVPPSGPGITDGLNLTFGGDNLLVYQTGPVGGPTGGYNATPIRFITALLANIRANDVPPVGNPTNYATWDPAPQTLSESSIPPGLINGITCFLMSPGPLPHLVSPVPGTVEPDNGKFSACGLSSAGTVCTALQMSAIIYNIANWTYQNTVFAVGTSSSLCTYTFSTPNSITLTSAAGTDAQTVCINTPITNITYSTTGATGATFSGLPAGVSGAWASNVVTISGSPTTTVGSPFNYTVTLTGGCGTVTATGTITVNPNNTITLSSAAGTNAQTVCINTAITNITYATTGATGATVTGLPAGVTGSWAANVVTISGTPTTTVGSPFNYTVTLTGGCGTVTATGSITVSPLNTVTLTSGAGTDAQTVNVGNPITNITYATTGATGATVSGLPAGVTGTWAANVVTISGSPSTAVGSPFNYTVTLTGGCGTVTATGTITVTTCAVTLTSAAGTNAQTVCLNTPITNITYSTIGATGATVTGLPAGVTSSWASDVVTISGTPTTTVGSPFTYTVTQTGGSCAGTTATGTITVNPIPDVTQPADQIVCNNGATAAVNFTGAVPGTVFNWTNTDPTIGLAASGTGNIASFTATNTTNAPVVATLTVTPSTGGGGGGGLVPELLYYKFDGSGTTVPNLASTPPGGTATATLQGGLTQGGSAICDGTIIGTGVSSTTDFLNTGWAPNLGTGSWTISFKSENITPSATLFYVFGDLNTSSFRCFTNGVAGANNWWLRGAGLTDVPLNGGATVAPHTNTFVYDAALNQVRAYLDGVLVNTVAQGAVNLTGAGPFKVNGYSSNVGSPLNGHYDEFKFFNRAITPAEVLGLNGCPALGPTCTGTPRTFTYTVNPTPTVDPVASEVVCNGAPTTAVNFTGFVPGTVYNWSNNNTAIGLAASGTGNIASFTATNTSTAPISGTITVTPTYTNAGVTCTGAPITFTITVNPSGQVDQPANQVLCNGASTTPVNFTTSVPGTVFDWVNNTPSIGLAASGTGNIPSFTATNAGTTPVTATITVTPSYAPVVSGSQTFNFTGGMQTWTVPAGVTSVFLQTWGAQGGSGAVGGMSVAGGSGGLGGYAEGTLAVTPGQVLNIFVGGQGATPTAGFNGGANGGSQNAGGGGGASDVRAGGTSATNRVITAGGGGGGGRGGCDEGAASTGGIGGNGGVGGGGVGQNGNNSPTSGGVAGGGFGGNAGSVQGALGAAGIGCGGFLGQPGNAAVTEVGGNGGGGQSCCCSSQPTIVGGGGGGGGQIGGGGGGGGSAGTTGCSGNSKGAGGGGGGGSSYIGGVTSGTTNNGIWLGNGMVTISYGTSSSTPCPGTTVTFTYTVNPTPVLICPANISQNNTVGQCGRIVTYTTNAPGMIPAPTVTYTFTGATTASGSGDGSGSFFNVGTTTVTITATNTCGTTSCSFTVTIIDNEPPTVTTGVIAGCYPTVAAAEAAALAATSATDNCPGALTETASTVGTCSAVITVTTTDVAGNSTAVTYNTRIDNTAPTVTVGTISSCYPTVAAAEAAALAATSATDNCPGALTEVASTVGTCSAVITITTTDGCGNATSVTYNTRIDNTPPVLTCPAPVTVSCAAAVPAPDITAVTGVTDNCPGAITVTHQGDVISAQTCANRYTVTRTYRATDVCGNFAECTQIITVNDQTPPVLTCPGPVTVSCAAAVPAPNIASVTGVSDNCAGVVTVTWQGDVISAQTCANRYTVTRTYRATDVCGNFAECTQIITVNDQTPPVLTCPGPVTVSCAAAVPAPNIASVTGVSDNCAGVVTVTWQGDVISNQTCANRYTVTRTYRATDVCGNFAECTQIITVNDQTPPVITCPAAITVSCASAVPAPNIASVTATDNCAGVITITHISDVITNQTCPNRFTLTRRYRATDVCGNFSECTQIITVNDQTPPVITCPANITVNTPVGSCTAVVNFTVTATDNCGAVTVVSVPASGSVFQIGTTTVTSTATDACGMTATCTFTVTVNDVQLPVITAQPANRTVCVGTTAVFSVTAITSPSPNGPLAYQWQLWNTSTNTWGDIAGATASTLTLTGVTHSMNANSYRVRIAGLCTTIISNHATLTVNPLPTISISTSIQPTLLPTQTVVLTANGSPGGGTYVWFKNNVVIPGATSQTLGPLNVLDAGTYKVTYTDPNGCVNTSADVIVKAQQSPNIWVYPNPNNGQFHIRFYNTTPQDVTVKVYDDLGQEIFSRKYPVPLPTYSVLDVDLGKRLAIGTYTVVLFNPANQRIGVKMIIVGRD